MEDKINNPGRARLMLIVSMVIFGTIGIFRRNIDLDSGVLAAGRGYIGAAFLMVMMLVSGRRSDAGAIRRNLKWLVLSGAMIGINWILLFEAYNYTTVAVATLCYYMAPVFVVLASPIVLDERLTLRKCVCVLMSLAGMVLISGIPGGGAPGGDYRGIAYGLGAAAFYASVILVNKRIRDIHPYDKTIIQLAVAATVLLPYIIARGGVGGGITIIGIVMLLVVGLIHTGLAYALYFGSMGHLPAQSVALYSYIDPIVAILLSALVLRERMGTMEVAGTVLILLGTILGG